MSKSSIRHCREADRHCGASRYTSFALAAALAFVATTATAADAPRLEFGADGSFAILHVTDIQDRGTLGKRSAAVLRASIAATKPQLVILTGDNVHGGSNSTNGFPGVMGPLLAIFREAGVPFCVTFGNHDSQSTGDRYLTRQGQYDWFKANGGGLFVDHDVPELFGVGSGTVELVVPGSDKPSVRLFVMDTGNHLPGSYDGCHATRSRGTSASRRTTYRTSGSSTSSSRTSSTPDSSARRRRRTLGSRSR